MKPVPSDIPLFSLEEEDLQLLEEIAALSKPRQAKKQSSPKLEKPKRKTHTFSMRVSPQLMEKIKERGGSIWVRTLIIQALDSGIRANIV